MRKARFSLNRALLISSILIMGFTMIMFALFGNFIFGKFQTQLFQQYRENAELVIEGYAETITFFLESHYRKLDFFAKVAHLSSKSKDEIIKEISQIDRTSDIIYQEIFYLTPEGDAYGFNGKKYKNYSGKYFKKAARNLREYFVTDPVYYEKGGYYLVSIGKPLEDEEGHFKGVIGFSMKLDVFKDFIAQIKISENLRLGLLDSEGRFIVHLNSPELVMNKFVPQDEDLKKYSSEYLSKVKSGFIKTEGFSGERIDVIFRPVEGTNWVLEIGIPHVKASQITFLKNAAYWIFLSVIVVVIVLLLVIENAVFSFFQKKKMIANNYDNLTNLWTRQKFEDECSLLLRHNKKSIFLLINADIRGFKFINQSYGGQAADKLLYYFSETLNIFTKRYKGLLARGYADRFYQFFKVENKECAIENFKKNLDSLNEIIKNYDIPFIPKFGLSFYSEEDGEDSVQGLIGKASFARATIKDNAIVQYAVYDSELLKIVNEEQYIEQHMEQALENKEFFVMYQPKIDLSTDKIVGAEALVRWKDPKLGIMPPAKFIPLFERNGFVKKLDFYVYDCVFKFVQKQLELGEPMVPVSVNMSRVHTKPEKFINEFMQIFKKYDVAPEYIEVEILERSIMEDDTLLEITNLLHKEGFKVAMDDFGVGESSLNMLTKIPVDVLKFDREFLLNSTNEKGEMDKKNAVFIQTLVNLSKNLEKQTIFEGVETKVQRDFLKKIKCDQVQGYFYSKPLTEDDFLQFLKQHL